MQTYVKSIIVSMFVFALGLLGCGSAQVAEGDAVVWMDANGVEARGVIGDPGGPLVYADPSGLFWSIDPDTALVSVAFDGTDDFDNAPAYTTPDCTLTEFVVASNTPYVMPEPLLTFTAPGVTGILRRNINVQSGIVQRCSIRSGDGCVPIEPCDHPVGLAVIPLTPSPALTIPVVPFAPPLYAVLPPGGD